MSVSHIDVSMNAPILHLRPRKKKKAARSIRLFQKNIFLNKSAPHPPPPSILRSDFNCCNYFLLVVSIPPLHGLINTPTPPDPFFMNGTGSALHPNTIHVTSNM